MARFYMTGGYGDSIGHRFLDPFMRALPVGAVTHTGEQPFRRGSHTTRIVHLQPVALKVRQYREMSC
jgi:hypothetical protein